MINEQITEKNEIISNDEPKISKSNNRKYLIENIASKIFMIKRIYFSYKFIINHRVCILQRINTIFI